MTRETMILNLGPQHPSTHGVLRVILELEGETVIDARPDIGFLHRGIEKIAEHRTWHQIIVLTDRLDYLAAMSNNLGYCLAVEKLMEIEVPRRAAHIRVALAELQRISSHLLWLGTQAHDLGAMTPLFYTLREREAIMDIFEALAGSRLTPSFLRIGGIAKDLNPEFARSVEAFLATFDSHVDEYEALLTENPIWRSRTKGIAPLPADRCLALGFTGPVLRSAGVAFDLRRAFPYSAYEAFDFVVPVGTQGDVFDRYAVRMAEMRQSARIVRQALDGMPEGPWIAGAAAAAGTGKDDPLAVVRQLSRKKPPAGAVYAAVESPRGEFGYYLESDGGTSPTRLKIRTPSFVHLQGLAEMVRGRLLSDVVAAIGSLDIVLGEVDR